MFTIWLLVRIQLPEPFVLNLAQAGFSVNGPSPRRVVSLSGPQIPLPQRDLRHEPPSPRRPTDHHDRSLRVPRTGLPTRRRRRASAKTLSSSLLRPRPELTASCEWAWHSCQEKRRVLCASTGPERALRPHADPESTAGLLRCRQGGVPVIRTALIRSPPRALRSRADRQPGAGRWRWAQTRGCRVPGRSRRDANSPPGPPCGNGIASRCSARRSRDP